MVIHNFYQIQGQILQLFQLIFDALNSRDCWYIVYMIKIDFFGGMGCNFWWFRPDGPNIWTRAGFGLPKIVKIRAQADFGLCFLKNDGLGPSGSGKLDPSLHNRSLRIALIYLRFP